MESLVVFSGGMDSTVLLMQEGRSKGFQNVMAVSFNYGQRHVRELQAAQAITSLLGVQWMVVDMAGVFSHMKKEGGSSLLFGQEVPDGHYAQANMVATIVPNRNMIMLSVAVGIAESMNIPLVCTAVHSGDHFIYPDCRPEFIANMRAAVWEATEKRVTVFAPFSSYTKAQIAQIGSNIGAPLHLSWSCYKGGSIHCGTCGTCVERIEAFRDGGVSDPTVYEDFERGLELVAS